MSDIHILTQQSVWTLESRDKDTADVVFHFTVPNSNNSAGVNFRTAMQEYLESISEGVITSQCPFVVGTQEETDMKAGIVYEFRESVDFPAGTNDAGKLSILQARWFELNTRLQSEFAEMLKQWGRSFSAT